MGKLFYFLASGGVPYSANADLDALKFRDVDEEMKPVLLDLMERLLRADSVSGPDSNLVLFHPFFLRSHETARNQWVDWSHTASRNQELKDHLTEENLLNWCNLNGYDDVEENETLTEMLSQVRKENKFKHVGI